MRFFSGLHPINRPAVPQADQSGWTTQQPGGPFTKPLMLNLDTYSVPVYDAATATGFLTLTQHPTYMSAIHFLTDSPANGPVIVQPDTRVVVPWSPAWFPADSVGGDRILCIVDRATGRAWDLWICDWAWRFLWWHSTAIVAASVRRYDNLPTRPYVDGRIISRGCGLEKLAGVLRVEELEEAVRTAGVVPHALSITIPNSRIGATYRKGCATRNELSSLAVASMGGVVTKVRPDTETMPSGTRWRLDWSEQDITAHVLRYGLTPGQRDTVGAVIRTMTVFGVFAGESKGETAIRCSIETDRSPATTTRWAQLGLTSEALTQPYQQCLAAIPASAWQVCEEIT